MRNANGMGSVVKLSGNRRKPWACRKTIGWKDNEEKGTSYPIYKYISYHATRREAEKALSDYNADPYCVSKATFKEVYDEWYALQEKTKAPGTLKNYRISFKHLESIHDKRVQDLTKKDLQRLFDSLDLTEIATDHVRKLMQLIFTYCTKRELLPVSYTHILKTIDKTSAKDSSHIERNPFTQSEIDELWKRKDNEIIKIILFYIYTGLRFSELKNLEEENVFDDYIRIVEAKTKAGVREVPLSNKVKSLLPLSQIPDYGTFNKYYHIAVGKTHTIHDTRHTFISLMVAKEVDERVIRSIVGHKSGTVTELYTHIPMDVKLEAVNRL